MRTRRYKYIRRYGAARPARAAQHRRQPEQGLPAGAGLAERRARREQLYDLVFDPNEAHNLVDDPLHPEVLADLAGRLDAWMRATDDPLLHGDVLPPPGAEVNDPAGHSASELPARESGAVR